MTRFAQPVTPRLTMASPAIIPAGADYELPVLEVQHFERVVLQWALHTPPAPRVISGTVTDWRFYRSALPKDEMMDRFTGQFFSPLARPDLWELATDIAFSALPTGVASTATTTWYCAGYTYLASVLDAATDLDTLHFTRSAYGP